MRSKSKSLKNQAEILTQKAIDAIGAIGTIASRRIPYPADWATTICSALKAAIDELEARLTEGQKACQPFRLSDFEEAPDDV